MFHTLGGIVIQHSIICSYGGVDHDGVERASRSRMNDAERLGFLQGVHVRIMGSFLGKGGTDGGIRTPNQGIMSALL
jgi:hypothetical protein